MTQSQFFLTQNIVSLTGLARVFTQSMFAERYHATPTNWTTNRSGLSGSQTEQRHPFMQRIPTVRYRVTSVQYYFYYLQMKVFQTEDSVCRGPTPSRHIGPRLRQISHSQEAAHQRPLFLFHYTASTRVLPFDLA